MRSSIPVPPVLPIADVNHQAQKGFASGVTQSALSGRPLPAPLRHQMETALGGDFSQVRIHENSGAQHMGAVAFTTGNDIHFAPGQYDPHSTKGQELIGHELTHVVQQRAGRALHVNDEPGFESEADALGPRATL